MNIEKKHIDFDKGFFEVKAEEWKLENIQKVKNDKTKLETRSSRLLYKGGIPIVKIPNHYNIGYSKSPLDTKDEDSKYQMGLSRLGEKLEDPKLMPFWKFVDDIEKLCIEMIKQKALEDKNKKPSEQLLKEAEREKLSLGEKIRILQTFIPEKKGCPEHNTIYLRANVKFGQDFTSCSVFNFSNQKILDKKIINSKVDVEKKDLKKGSYIVGISMPNILYGEYFGDGIYARLQFYSNYVYYEHKTREIDGKNFLGDDFIDPKNKVKDEAEEDENYVDKVVDEEDEDNFKVTNII